MRPTLKFALYGRKNSGKTCILTALSMKRAPHPSEYTASRPSQLQKNVSELDQKQAGKKLDEAKQSLLEGTIPEATANDSKPLPYLFQFDTPEHQGFDIEFIDYSGELIDPQKSTDEVAKILKARMEEMDALFLVVEVPSPEDADKQIHELSRLEDAFRTLEHNSTNSARVGIPLGLIISKFDRFADTASLSEGDNLEALANKFLEDKLGMNAKPMAIALKNFAQEGFYGIFPVSAFGPSEEFELVTKEDGTKRIAHKPKILEPLQSFHLEDPFIWAAKKVAIKKIFYLQSRLEQPLWLLITKIAWFEDVLGLAEETKHLFPEGTEEAKKASAFHKKASRIHYAGIVVATALFLTAILLLEFGYDSYSIRRIEQRINDPRTAKTDVFRDINWYQNYSACNELRHILARMVLLNRKEADKKANAIQELFDNHHWQLVASGANLLEQSQQAEEYLKLLPNGRHLDKAKAVLSQNQYLVKQEKHKLDLTNLSQKFDELASSPGNIGEEKLNSLEKEIDILITSAGGYSVILTDALNLKHRISSRRAIERQTLSKNQWDRKVVEIDTNIVSRNITKWQIALEELVNLKQHDGGDLQTWREIAGDTLMKLMENLDNKSKEFVVAKEFENAKQLLKEYENSPALSLVFKDIPDLGIQHKIGEFLKDVIQKENAYLYDELQKFSKNSVTDLERNKDHILRRCENYLSVSTRKNIKAVQQFQKYLQNIREERLLKIKLKSITWPETQRFEATHAIKLKVGSGNEESLKITTPGKTGYSFTANISPIKQRVYESFNISTEIEFDDWGGNSIYERKYYSQPVVGSTGFSVEVPNKESGESDSCTLYFEIIDDDPEMPLNIPVLPN